MGGMSHGGAITRSDLWTPGHHGLDVFGVRTLELDPASAADPAWRARLAAPRWQGRVPGTFENTQALPRAWRVATASLLPPERVDGRMTADPTFDPGREALVESPLATDPTPGTATAQAFSANRIRLETAGAGPGLAVVSEGYDPGWKAFEGDRALPVHRVDGLILGVEVPPGSHTIELRYAPPRWGLGLAISVTSALLMLGWALGIRQRRA
jgi:hypothetical protein